MFKTTFVVKIVLIFYTQGKKLGSCLLHPTSFVLHFSFILIIAARAVLWTVGAMVAGVLLVFTIYY